MHRSNVYQQVVKSLICSIGMCGYYPCNDYICLELALLNLLSSIVKCLYLLLTQEAAKNIEIKSEKKKLSRTEESIKSPVELGLTKRTHKLGYEGSLSNSRKSESPNLRDKRGRNIQPFYHIWVYCRNSLVPSAHQGVARGSKRGCKMGFMLMFTWECTAR